MARAQQQQLSATHGFMTDFFPSLEALLQRVPALWDRLQPAWMVERCVEDTLAMFGDRVSIRNPWLLPAQLLGAAVGGGGFAYLLRLRPLRLRWANAYHAHSCLFFLFMNLSSIAAHALLPRHSSSWMVFVCLDVAFTGASSAAAVMAALLRPPGSAAAAGAAAARCSHALVLMLSVAAAGAMLGLPWVPEACYLGTTMLAVFATAHRRLMPEARSLLRDLLASSSGGRRSSGGGKAHAAWRRRALAIGVAAAGAALMAVCLPADAWLCATVGHPALSTVPLLFLGSDLAFLGLVLLVGAGAPAAPRSTQS